MNKTIITIIVLLVLGLGIYYFVSNNGSSGTTIDTSQLPPVNPPAANIPPVTPSVNNPAVTPASISVSISNFSFSPGTLTIKPGTKVTWTNNDVTSHTVTSDLSGLFGSGTLAPGQSFSFTFTSPDSINYHCNIHPTMKGVVVVQN